MKKCIFLFILSTIIWSCDNDDEVKAEDKLTGNWELSHTLIGSVHKLSPMGGLMYIFDSDHTFTKTDLLPSSWRDEGTWVYNEDTKELNLTFKTYSSLGKVSDTKELSLTIEKLTDKELVLKADYNKENFMGDFVEFAFAHYLKK